MKHISYEQWLIYINDELEEALRSVYETHLYQCDECLLVYMEAMETIHYVIPEQTTDTIMQNLNKQFNIESEGVEDKSNFHRKSLLHYTIAAAMTLVLMSSGIFSQFTNIAHDIETDNTSFITELLNNSFSIIDQVKFKERE